VTRSAGVTDAVLEDVAAWRSRPLEAVYPIVYYQWREKLLESGQAALAGRDERQGERDLRRKVAELERALGRKTYRIEREVEPGEIGLGAKEGTAP
jgi:hypothetical protein